MWAFKILEYTEIHREEPLQPCHFYHSPMWCYGYGVGGKWVSGTIVHKLSPVTMAIKVSCNQGRLSDLWKRIVFSFCIWRFAGVLYVQSTYVQCYYTCIPYNGTGDRVELCNFRLNVNR